MNLKGVSFIALLCSIFYISAVLGDGVPTETDDEIAPRHYFWNQITGETQWEDPGGVPYLDDDGSPYWLDDDGETKLYTDHNAMKYAWVEGYSEEHSRPFYYNQETAESIWSKPADLAWIRVPVKDEL